MMRFFIPAVAALLLLGACSSDEQKSTTESAPPPEKFPNLATVPDQPPPSTPKIERDKLVQGLLADRAHAEYTGKLGEETANVPAAAPPPPAPPAPESEAKPASDGASEQTAAAAEQPAPPPREVAALPADLGQATALIYFAGDTADLTDHDRAILGDVATKYKGERSSRVRVIGHASAAEKAAAASGSERSDLALARAEAVAKTLISMGVAANALETSSGGADYDESQPTGVAANRRVAIYIGS